MLLLLVPLFLTHKLTDVNAKPTNHVIFHGFFRLLIFTDLELKFPRHNYIILSASAMS